MPKEYDNTNSGALFKNNNKEKETQPDMSGSLDVEGKQYRIAAWSNESKTGIKYLSIKLTEKQEAQQGDFLQGYIIGMQEKLMRN